MVSELKFLYNICNVFLCCMSINLDNAYIGMSKGMRSMEIVPGKGKMGRKVFKVCSKLLSLAEATVSMVHYSSLCRTLGS